MLGWFKKKFGKQESQEKENQTSPSEAVLEAPETVEEVLSGEIEQVPPLEKESETELETVVDDPKDSTLDSAEELSLENEVISDSLFATKKEIEKIEEPEVQPPIETEITREEVTLEEDVPTEPEDSSTSQDEPTATDAVQPATSPQEIEPDPQSTPEPSEPVAEIELETVPQTRKAEKEKPSLFSRLSQKLSKTKESFTYQMDALFLGKKEIDQNLLDDLEEILITADVGVATTEELLETIRRRVNRKELTDPEALRKHLKKQITGYILDNEADATLVMPKKGPFVIMVIGVNGVGKTTTIGKIANKFINSGQSVMLAAADTFRAAAVSQLKIWGERNGVPVIAHKEGADPSSVVFDALSSAIAKNVDVLLVDTAGRMHTKDNLMEELKKIKRVMKKKLPAAPHETLLVIDATTGQNGVSQARLFDNAVEVTGLALTKLDGTSKGGIVVNICREMKIPIRFIGIGEQVDDLRDFDAGEFAEALFSGRQK